MNQIVLKDVLQYVSIFPAGNISAERMCAGGERASERKCTVANGEEELLLCFLLHFCVRMLLSIIIIEILMHSSIIPGHYWNGFVT